MQSKEFLDSMRRPASLVFAGIDLVRRSGPEKKWLCLQSRDCAQMRKSGFNKCSSGLGVASRRWIEDQQEQLACNVKMLNAEHIGPSVGAISK